jgi:hypothetical protein
LNSNITASNEKEIKEKLSAMSKGQRKRRKLRERRLTMAFFFMLTATSERASTLRKTLDSCGRTKTVEEQLLACGMNMGMSKTSSKRERRNDLQDYGNRMIIWIKKLRDDHNPKNALLLAHDDLFLYKRKNTFNLMQLEEQKEKKKTKEIDTNKKKKKRKDTKKINSKAKANKALLKKGMTTCFQQTYAVGVTKVLQKAPRVIQCPTSMNNPEYLSVQPVVDFVMKAVEGPDGNASDTFAQQFMKQQFLPATLSEEIKNKIPTLASMYEPQNILRRIEESLYTQNSDASEARNAARLALNHLLSQNFKSFKEFLRSLFQYMINPVIWECLTTQEILIILGDFPCWDRMRVLLLQGEGVGRRTPQHLGDLFKHSVSDSQKQEFKTARGLTDTQEINWVEVAVASQNFLPMSGRFHIRLNLFTDTVDFWAEFFNDRLGVFLLSRLCS